MFRAVLTATYLARVQKVHGAVVENLQTELFAALLHSSTGYRVALGFHSSLSSNGGLIGTESQTGVSLGHFGAQPENCHGSVRLDMGWCAQSHQISKEDCCTRASITPKRGKEAHEGGLPRKAVRRLTAAP